MIVRTRWQDLLRLSPPGWCNVKSPHHTSITLVKKLHTNFQVWNRVIPLYHRWITTLNSIMCQNQWKITQISTNIDIVRICYTIFIQTYFFKLVEVFITYNTKTIRLFMFRYEMVEIHNRLWFRLRVDKVKIMVSYTSSFCEHTTSQPAEVLIMTRPRFTVIQNTMV